MLKTTSLELSKQLKAAGFPQKSSFWYLLGDWEESEVGLPAYIEELGGDWFTDKWKELRIAAPTTEEILEQLPHVLDKHCHLKIFRQDSPGNYNGKYWHIAYNEIRHACGKPNQMAWQDARSNIV